MYRYLVIVGSPRSAEWARTLERLQLAQRLPESWRVSYEGTGILAMHVPRATGMGRAYPLERRAGVVLGRLFDRRCEDYSVPREVTFDAAQCATIVSSGGQHLIDRYWGSYLAILYDAAADKHHVLCDPIGTLPCHHLRHAGADIFFSHAEDAVRLLQARLEINRDYLTKWLIFCSVQSDDTALNNLTRLPRGQRLTLSQTNRTWSQVWDPVAIASDPRHADPNEAAHALRQTTRHAVDAWASCYRRITHKLSGGLDSSILAAYLAQARTSPDVTYLNMRIDAEIDQQTRHLPGVDDALASKLRALVSSADQRYFARLVAKRWNVPIVERRRDSSMDLTRLLHAPLRATPALYFTNLEMDDAEMEMISSYGAEAFFSGQAGDSVLMATLQPLSSIDHAYLHGITGELWSHIVATAALTKDSLWSVIGKTLKHGLLRRPYISPWRLLEWPTLVTRGLASSLREEDLAANLSRLAATSSLPPGKRSHIQGLACAYYDFAFHAGERADHIDPLNSQPVWELALRIPTYTLLTGGVSRGLARQAFADLLPPEIRKRQTKGTGATFYQHIVRNNRGYLREQLADGLLVQQGYLDRGKLLECLAMEEPSLMINSVVLLSYLSAEIWLQRITDAMSNVTSLPLPAVSQAAR
jgi:asparagine synthase (glutamine-hydrolysing)